MDIDLLFIKMAFDDIDVGKLLAKCHRRCCVCHKFCGVKMEVHHVHWRSKGGSDDIENAIPLCFECHAEVNHYNPQHPKGRKFTQEELLVHKKQWLEICANHPEALIAAPRDTDIGPLEGMMLELEFNQSIINRIMQGSSWQENIGCALHDREYLRAVEQGSLLLLSDELRAVINTAYSEVSRINTFTRMYSNTRPEGNAFAEATNRLLDAYRKSNLHISSAFSQLRKMLQNEGDDDHE